jgi:hypothetical protein
MVVLFYVRDLHLVSMEAKESWQGDKNLDKMKPAYPATNWQRYAYTYFM